MSSIVFTQAFTNTLSQYFNKQELSDCTIRFPSTKSTLRGHKFILMAHSDFFKLCFQSGMKESTDNEIEIDDDERLVSILIQSLYCGTLSIPSNNDIVPLILLADKYQIVSLVPLLCNHYVKRMDSSNVMQGLDLDLDDSKYSRVKARMQVLTQSVSDDILTQRSYLNLSVEKFMSALGLLVNRTKSLNAYDAVHAWIEKDEENRAQFSYSLMKTVKQTAAKEPTATPGPKWTFSDVSCPKGVEIVSPTSIRCIDKNGGHKFVFMDANLSMLPGNKIEWKFKIEKLDGWIGIGVANKEHVRRRQNWTYRKIGHGAYLLSSNGCSWSHTNPAENYRQAGLKYTTNDIIQVCYDKTTQSLSFCKGTQVVTINNIDRDVHPVVVLQRSGDSVSLIPN